MNATIKFNTTFQAGSFQAGSLTLIPELRVGYAIAAKSLNNPLTVGFAGASGAAKILGTRSRGGHFQAGFSLEIKSGGMVDAFISYNLATILTPPRATVAKTPPSA